MVKPFAFPEQDGPASCASRDESRIAALEAEIAARDLFIATLGHELRNPMVPIMLSVDRLKRQIASGEIDKLRGTVETLDKAADAFMRRATQLLDLSRIGGGGLSLAAERVGLGELLAEAAARHRDTAQRAQCELRFLPQADCAARGDRASVEQILDNVLLNAFKYGHGRPVELTFWCSGDRATVSVRDHGPGVPEEAQAAIFDLFGRGPRQDAPGLGIGLFISARLAEAMGGRLGLAPAEGGGAAFHLELPLYGEAGAAA